MKDNKKEQFLRYELVSRLINGAEVALDMKISNEKGQYILINELSAQHLSSTYFELIVSRQRRLK